MRPITKAHPTAGDSELIGGSDVVHGDTRHHGQLRHCRRLAKSDLRAQIVNLREACERCCIARCPEERQCSCARIDVRALQL